MAMTQRGGVMDYNQFLGSMHLPDDEDSKKKYSTFTGVPTPPQEDVQLAMGPGSRPNPDGTGSVLDQKIGNALGLETKPTKADVAKLTPVEEPVEAGPTEEELLAQEAQALNNQKMGFWDSLADKKDILDAAGIPMSDKSAADVTPEELDKLIQENPRWWNEYQESNSLSMPDAIVEEAVVDEAVVDEPIVEVDEEGIPSALTDAPTDEINPTIVETEEDEIIEEAIPSKWKNDDGSIDWKFIGQVAAGAGITVAKVLEGAVMSYVAQKTGRDFDFQADTYSGRELAAQLAGESQTREETFAEKLASIDEAANKIQREYETERSNADMAFEIDRDADAHKNRLEEIGKQEEAATQRLYAAAAIQKSQNTALGLGVDDDVADIR